MIAEAQREVIRRTLALERERRRRARARDLVHRLDGLQAALERANLDGEGMTPGLEALARERFVQAAAFLGEARPPVPARVAEVMEAAWELQQGLMDVLSRRRAWRPPPDEDT